MGRWQQLWVWFLASFWLGGCGGGGSGGAGNQTDPDVFLIQTAVVGGGVIEPSEQLIEAGSTGSFTIALNAGYELTDLSGCPGDLIEAAFQLAAVTEACTLTLTAMPIMPEPAQQVVNLHTGVGPVHGGFQAMGPTLSGVTFFRAEDGAHGSELWRTDGTASGTFMVRDIHKGVGSSSPTSLTAYQGRVCFSADDGNVGAELWCSDGTAAGTQLIKVIRPGRMGSSPQSLTVLGDTLFFSADDGANGRELWRTDGTEAGTFMVRDIRPGAQGSNPGSFGVVGNVLLFNADDGVHGRELWRSQGTAGSTVLVRDINDGSASSISTGSAVVHDGIYYFAATDGDFGVELWRSDGTTFGGTYRVRDIRVGSASSSPRNLHSTPLGIIFWAHDGDDVQAWISDGTQAGTQKLGGGSNGQFYSVVYAPGATHGDVAYFTGGSEYGLWKTDGTEAGTELVGRIPDSTSTIDLVTNKVFFNSRLYFQGYSNTVGTELYYYTGANTIQLTTDLNPGISGSQPIGFEIAGNQLLFGASQSDTGRELWRLGTTGLPTQVKNLAPDGGSSHPRLLGSLGDALLFTAYTEDFGRELWRTQGSSASTDLVLDINPGSISGISNFDTAPHPPVFHQGHLYFNASSPGVGNELWRSDGTTAGTAVVANICQEYSNCGSQSFLPGGFRVSTGEYLFFIANKEDSHGTNTLWRTDGVTTVEVADDLQLREFMNVSRPMAAMGNTLYFQATPSGSLNLELWKVIGTGSPQLVRDIYPGDRSMPDWLTPIEDQLFFSATTAAQGRELWKTDGTFAGTQLVKDIAADAASSDPEELTEHDGVLYFTAQAASGARTLWRSDGTAAGTLPVTVEHEGSPGVDPFGLASTSLGLVFAANTTVTGTELWLLEPSGTSARLIADIEPGPDGAVLALSSDVPRKLNHPYVGRRLEVVDSGDGRVLFPACTSAGGCQLWISDGTELGTFAMTDLGPEPGGASPGFITLIGDDLYFAATDSLGQREVWHQVLPK